jgi:hypothetical protein
MFKKEARDPTVEIARELESFDLTNPGWDAAYLTAEAFSSARKGLSLERIRIIYGADIGETVSSLFNGETNNVEGIVNREDADDMHHLRKQHDALLDLLSKLVGSDVGRNTLWKLSTGQGTETEDGKAWLAAQATVIRARNLGINK